MTHDLALGEVASLAQKAARGGGRSYGQAEDAGRAVRWLCARGFDGAGALDALLRADPAIGLCPLSFGGYLSDLGGVSDAPTDPIIVPILLAPFLAQIAGAGGIIMEGQEVAIHVCADDLSGEAVFTATRITLRVSADVLPERAHKTRITLARPVFDSLHDFAARTYAPATEESRARGAGAGTSDND